MADLIERAGADGVIVSGTGTGKAADVEELSRVKAVSGETPVFVGSGVSLDSLEDYVATADGFIVGSYFKVDGKVDNPVDPTRAKEFMKKLRSL